MCACVQMTGRLVVSELGVDARWISSVPLHSPVYIAGVRVTLFDANHCPGAAMILFERGKERVYVAPRFARGIAPSHLTRVLDQIACGRFPLHAAHETAARVARREAARFERHLLGHHIQHGQHVLPAAGSVQPMFSPLDLCW